MPGIARCSPARRDWMRAASCTCCTGLHRSSACCCRWRVACGSTSTPSGPQSPADAPHIAMTTLLFTGARVFDGQSADCAEGMQVLVADGLIQEVTAQPVVARDARVIDVGGRTLMPGLIDAHVHAF